MILIDEKVYRDTANSLIDAVADENFFNGTVESSWGEFEAKFTATLIIYRSSGRITDIVPVWWEFHLIGPDGEELTDFCWSELRRHTADRF